MLWRRCISRAARCTSRPRRGTDAEIEVIQSLIKNSARVAEIRAWYRVAGNLLTTYVGKNTSKRVLHGGVFAAASHPEAIHAAIWLSDMRGFAVFADALPPVLVDLLNRYFDCRCRRS